MKTIKEIEPTITEHLKSKEDISEVGDDFCGYSQDDMYEACSEFYTAKLKDSAIEDIKELQYKINIATRNDSFNMKPSTH